LTGLLAFPVLYVSDVTTVAAFYELLGFSEQARFPVGTPDPGYIRVARDGSHLGIASEESPRWLAGITPGPGPRHQFCVYVADLGVMLNGLRLVATVLCEPVVMPSGQLEAYIADPEGNVVVIVQAAGATPWPAAEPGDPAV
jgi:predicted enzyme related to lactoylglutathione lyase